MAEEYAMPPPVREFLHGFYAAVKAGRPHEIQSYCDKQWREVSKRFFTTSSWPTAREIAPLVKEDRSFLVLYRLMFYKHLLTALATPDHPPSLAQYTEAWNAYVDFFIAARDPAVSGSWELPASWVYDLFSDLLYHFQRFQEYRLSPVAAAMASAGEDGEDAAPVTAPDVGDVELPKLMRAWQLGDIMSALHSIVTHSDVMSVLAASAAPGGYSLGAGPAPMPTSFRTLSGYFALVCLVRMYTKLGDYASAIECARPLNALSGEGLFVRIQKCHISLQYYLGFALLMSRRFEDAHRVFSRTLLQFRNVLADQNAAGNYYIKRQGEKMFSLLCIAAAVCPGALWDEPVRRALRDRMQDKLEHISSASTSAEADIHALFMDSAPGFFVFAPLPEPTDLDGMRAHIEAARALDNAHLKLLTREVMSRTSGLGTLRSYLRLYTNIDTGRLADYCGTTPADVRSTLIALKLKSWQTGPSPVPASTAADASSASATAGGVASSSTSNDPLHFFIVGETVSIQESRAAPSSNFFFMRGIDTAARVMRDTVADGSAAAAAAKHSAGPHRGGAYRGRGGGPAGSGGFRRHQQ